MMIFSIAHALANQKRFSYFPPTLARVLAGFIPQLTTFAPTFFFHFNYL